MLPLLSCFSIKYGVKYGKCFKIVAVMNYVQLSQFYLHISTCPVVVPSNLLCSSPRKL